PQLFPGRIRGLPGFLWGEAQLYNFAQKLCPDYRGGFWSFYRLSNTGLYAAPEMERATVPVQWADNFFDGEMSPDAFGIVATLFALSAACCVSPSDVLAARYDTLRDFAAEHDERNLIFRAID
ncbi:antirestriction protein, partial [Kozakia baliensis]|uniref:antirestriction protein n=1 Tax=Kozakia baliensis TaxID=153496 RepID=UPI0011BF48C5